MWQHRYLVATAVVAAIGAAIFFIVVENALERERWGLLAGAVTGFGGYMAAVNVIAIRVDDRPRSIRNLAFEHATAQVVGVLGVAWALVAALDHLRWQQLAFSTVTAAPFLVLVHVVTRRTIKGEDPDELFA
ncbi:MAG: hypothetical protein H0V96_06825 [Acidimicrobiia bacterium]|nr:hypothetical protein [Acidimicrobiia bacterium]